MSNVSTQHKNVACTPKRLIVEGSPLQSQSDVVDRMIATMNYMDKVRKHYRFDEVSREILMRVNVSWLRCQSGLSSYEICKLVYGEISGSLYKVLNARLHTMVRKGLIESIGRTRVNGNIYIPTTKAIREFNALVMKISEL